MSSPTTFYGHERFRSNRIPTKPNKVGFNEGALLKATNIYQQFDKKGNIFENRLYAKTSINQAKLADEQATYMKKMESKPDEICRINNV